jgi:hypothetical protein
LTLYSKYSTWISPSKLHLLLYSSSIGNLILYVKARSRLNYRSSCHQNANCRYGRLHARGHLLQRLDGSCRTQFEKDCQSIYEKPPSLNLFLMTASWNDFDSFSSTEIIAYCSNLRAKIRVAILWADIATKSSQSPTKSSSNMVVGLKLRNLSTSNELATY